MAQLEGEQLYLDLQAFRKELTKCGYEMEARNRVDYLVPIKDDIRECILAFARAHRAKKERKVELVNELDALFILAKIDYWIADDEHIWRGKKDEFGNCKCATRMMQIMARIDEGIGKWRNSFTKGRTAPELERGSIS